MKPSRVLNERSFAMGLEFPDIALLGISLLPGRIVGDFLGVQALAILFPILLGALLVPIRLRFRRLIIRDFLGFYLSRRVINVSKNH